MRCITLSTITYGQENMNGMNGSGNSSGKSTPFSRGKTPNGNALPPSMQRLSRQSPRLSRRLSHRQKLSPDLFSKVRSMPQSGSLRNGSPPPNGPWQKKCVRTPTGQGTKPPAFPSSSRTGPSLRLNNRLSHCQDLSPDLFPKIRLTPQNGSLRNGKNVPMSK